MNNEIIVKKSFSASAEFFCYSSGYYVVLQRYVQILRCVQDDTTRNVVILSAAKDLYEMCMNNILNLSSYFGPMTMNPEL